MNEKLWHYHSHKTRKARVMKLVLFLLIYAILFTIQITINTSLIQLKILIGISFGVCVVQSRHYLSYSLSEQLVLGFIWFGWKMIMEKCVWINRIFFYSVHMEKKESDWLVFPPKPTKIAPQNGEKSERVEKIDILISTASPTLF